MKEDRSGRETLDTVVSFTARIVEDSYRRLNVPSLLYAIVIAPALEGQGLCWCQECVSPDVDLDFNQ